MKIYLDSCILVAYFSNIDREKEKREQVMNVFQLFQNSNDVEIFISHWTISEMMNVMLSSMKLDNSHVLKCESELLNKKRIENVKINIIDVNGKDKKYDFQEFMYEIRENILKYHSGVGDIIHSVIMKKNDLDIILTFDEKPDFKKIEGLTVVHPREVFLENE